MKGILLIVLLVVGLDALWSLVGSEVEAGSSLFRQVGYFKSGSRDRIFTIEFSPSASERQVRAKADALMYTPGQMTAAYFYPQGSVIPADGVTLGGSVWEVNRVLYEVPGLSRWRYAFIRYRTGQADFVDCNGRRHDLCRP